MRRNRLLALRLTDEEYQRLKSACATAGGHNLSEFSRHNLLHVTVSDPALVVERLSSLENRVADLQSDIRNLGANADRQS
jgi:hypothetical protein